MSKTFKIILFLILLILIIGLIVANLFLVDIVGFFYPRVDQTGELSLTPALVDETENLYKVDIKFKSSGDENVTKSVSAVAFSLSYPKDPNVVVDIVDAGGNPANQVELGPMVDSAQWEVPINTITNSETGVEIEFAAVNTTPAGFTTSDFVVLGTIYFKSEKPLNQDVFVLSFNTDNSAIITKLKPTEDILDTDARLYYSVE